MDPLRELLGVNDLIALNFFHQGLREVTGKRSSDQMIYVASILAHFATTSQKDHCVPFEGLGEVFDRFVFTDDTLYDPEILEIAGSQIIYSLASLGVK